MQNKLKNIFKQLIIRFVFVFIFIYSKTFLHFSIFIGNTIRFVLWKIRLQYLGRNSKIYPYVIIHSPENVKIGSNVSIAEFTHIWGGGGGDWG